MANSHDAPGLGLLTPWPCTEFDKDDCSINLQETVSIKFLMSTVTRRMAERTYSIQERVTCLKHPE